MGNGPGRPGGASSTKARRSTTKSKEDFSSCIYSRERKLDAGLIASASSRTRASGDILDTEEVGEEARSWPFFSRAGNAYGPGHGKLH